MKVLAILTSLLCAVEAFWLFGWSAHVAPWLETWAPLYFIGSLAAIGFSYRRLRRDDLTRSHFIATCAAAVGVGILMGAIAVVGA